jgi:hypothetical protein
MKANLILQELEQVADRLGWEIRYEQGDFQSGFCIKDEQRLIIIQRKSTSTERLRHIARILAQENLDGVFLLPQVRKIVDEHRDGYQ